MTQSADSYRGLADEPLLEELRSLAADIRGSRVAHINATANGGGVSEILRSIIPLYRGLGVDASWLVLRGEERFFATTKKLHNALQGADVRFSPEDWDTYMACNRQNAASLSSGYDVVFVHDPQPAAIPHFAQDSASRWVWRCHIDTSTPNPEAWRALTDMLSPFNAAVFSAPEFAGPNMSGMPVYFFPPAIDPLVPKNLEIPLEKAQAVVARCGVDPSHPYIAQISRFDPWKDPLGVIDCFEQLQALHQNLQLVLLGNFADDDPEGRAIYHEVLSRARKLENVHIIVEGRRGLAGPFQTLARVVIQKSLREGFGLTVTEALWKGTPVVAGNVGGIRLQVRDGIGGFLVDTVEECANRVHYLLTHEEQRVALGAAGREHVRSNFLLPRLLRDEMRLIKDVLSTSFVPAASASQGDHLDTVASPSR